MATVLIAGALALLGLLVAALGVVWMVWLRQEEQRERMRQAVNGGGTDLPRWLKLRENRRNYRA